jgi:outer membrane protein assembly factor BamB
MNLPTTFTATTAKTESLDGTGILVAIEADTGDILWETEFDDIVVGSATVVNDLVITSVFGGIVYALDRATGESVWSYKASAGLNAPMAIAGDTIIVPAGMPNQAGNKTRLIALRLAE